MHGRAQSLGFTLVELMVSMVIGLLLVAGIASVFLQTQASARQDTQIAALQDNARYALHVLSDDIRGSGFFGGIVALSEIATNDTTLDDDPLTSDCGSAAQTEWAYEVDAYGGPVQILTGATATEANTAHGCIPIVGFQPDSPVLSLKRTQGTPLPNGSALVPNRVYLRTNQDIGCLWYYDGSSAPTAGTCPMGIYDDWAYFAHVYYVRDHTEVLGDGIPSLCRYALDAGPAMVNQCLAEGIETFHVEWGVDNDDPKDGVVDEYTATPADVNDAIAARIYVLARSPEALKGTAAVNKEYRLGSVTKTYNDQYYRRVYSTTVLLRNQANRSIFF
jgi:type IV pilus assembly protein PilW